jgi:tetraacyldisaccharide 4'-kinase
LGLFSLIYRLGLSCHKLISKPHRLPVKVISIGNITLGGTGKTPATISVAKAAKNSGLSPCILTRGYKAKSGDTCFISKGDGPLISAADAGDEAYLMAEMLRGIPVVKGKNRYEAGLLALKEYSSPVFILDDGFQHWGLQRDIDIVLIDATNPFGNKKLFPEGILREPLTALKRAHVIIITKSDITRTEAIATLSQKVRKINPDATVFTAFHKPVELVDAAGNATELKSLVNKKVYLFTGIANAMYFESILRTNRAQIIDSKKFRDHHSYTQKDIDKIKSDAMGLDIITTEKDMVKLKRLNVPHNIHAFRIEFTVDNEFYENIFRRLQ